MKKYLFGVFAIALAIGFSAFTNPKPSNAPLTNAFFAFDYATYSSPTEADIEDESKWVFVSSSSCTSGFNAACEVEVSPTYYSGTTLLSTAALDADASGSYPIIGGNTVSIVNKP